MHTLLVYPKFPLTYWGFQHGLSLIGKRASLPPLGLITLAACLPQTWDLRLVDLNVTDLSEDDLAWADVVLVGGMLIQSESMLEVMARARACGKRVVAGGPGPTTSPEVFADADVVCCGEVEGRGSELVAAIEGKGHCVIEAPKSRPTMDRVPVPRFDLLALNEYASMAIQYSRGCPFQCEFCDIIEIFGRVARVKAPEQVLAELDRLYSLGYRGSVFLVDDNFIGNRRAVKQLLPRVESWQNAHGRPFELYTEASVNLGSDDALIESMVRAGFSSVFLGIESPSKEALGGAGKVQNVHFDPMAAVEKITRAGIEVMGGFIVGFDEDTSSIFDLQRDFIGKSPIPLAMAGILTALPSTALHRRLTHEGRIRRWTNGDQFARPNFTPKMDEAELLSGYADLLSEIYSEDGYYRRCHAYLDRAETVPSAAAPPSLQSLVILYRVLVGLGIKSPRRAKFWKLLARALPKGFGAVRWAIAHGLQGEHLIRYTQEEVLPRLARSRDEALTERRSRAETAAHARIHGPRPAPTPENRPSLVAIRRNRLGPELAGQV